MHRSLGVHVSQVRSTTLDTWLPKQVAFITAMGNHKANRYWERRLPAGFKRPTDGHRLMTFIRNKYVDKMYVPHDMPPPDIQNYQSHPYCMDEKTPAADVQTPPKKNKSAPQLCIEKTIPTVEPVRRTPLVIQPLDFISLGDDVVSNQSAPQSVGNSDWEPFAGASPVKELPVEKSAASWNTFDAAPQTNATSPDLLDSHSSHAVATSDPFGLDALPPSPKKEAVQSDAFGYKNASESGQQSTEDILKLYDVPKRTNEPPLPPNLGLPMGPQGMHSLYPSIGGAPYQPYGVHPQMGAGHMYPPIAVPNQNFASSYGQNGAYFNASGTPPQQFYGQGHK